MIHLRAPRTPERSNLRSTAGLTVPCVRLRDVDPVARGGRLRELEGVRAIALGSREPAVVTGNNPHRGVARGDRTGPRDQCRIGCVAVLRKARDTAIEEIELGAVARCDE